MSKIITSRCDCCGANRVPVNISFRSGASQNLCRVCDPEGFETQARADIEAWLRGDLDADSRLGL
jgi:hypothetical protein